MQAILGLLLLVASTAPAAAHHGWSSYDSTRELPLTGTITESGDEHPHGHGGLDGAGKISIVVLAPPTRMEHRGLPASKLRVGTKATVVGYPHRITADEMRAGRTSADGA